MIRLFGGRAASAVIGFLMLGAGSSAQAQDALGRAEALQKATSYQAASLAVNPSPLAARPAAVMTFGAVPVPAQPAQPALSAQSAQSAQSADGGLRPAIAKEAAWLYKGGWPLYALVEKFASNTQLDEQTNCLATAVYFEARGESLEGQLAVARVVMNRAASNKYPPDWCSVVKQPWQFSFVRNGQFPAADTNSDAWRKAVAIAELAAANIVPSVEDDVLWYHANYVAPSWGRRLSRVERIGAHIFYRS